MSDKLKLLKNQIKDLYKALAVAEKAVVEEEDKILKETREINSEKAKVFNESKRSFIFYKKVYKNSKEKDTLRYGETTAIVKLKVPAGALRSMNPDLWHKNWGVFPFNAAKLRVNEAEVLEIWETENPDKKLNKGYSMRDRSFVYQVGKTVKPVDTFDTNHKNDCSSGIHGYLSKKAAQNHF